MSRVGALITIIRYVYVGIAFGLVCNAFYKEYVKFIKEDVSRRQEYKTSEQRRYPSITFCNKYKHGTKHVIDNYLSKFVEKAKANACDLDLIRTEGKVIKSLTGIQNSSMCNDHCQSNGKCSVWTYFDGLCYMKNDKTFLIKTENNRIVSGMKECTDEDCVMVGVDMYGGDLEAIPANDFHECRKNCNESHHCKRWTYQASKEGACFLKNEFIRTDGGCGENYPLSDGSPAWCNPSGEAYCCSEWGFCGSSEAHCNCEKCIDFRNKTVSTVDNEDEEKEEKVYRPNVDVSICHHCKTGFRDSNNIQCGATGVYDHIKVDLAEMIPHRTSFLSNFSQRFQAENFGVDVLTDDKNWKSFIANENSGPCYTYNPPHNSDPGDTNSMYMVFNFSDWDPLLEIFIHDKNDFYYSKRTMLNTKVITSSMLNETQTKYPRALVKISTERKISTTRMQCNKDPEYSFFNCVEKYYIQKRGCTYPWDSNEVSNTTICEKYSNLSSLIWYYNQNIDTGAGRENFKLSEILLKIRNECPPPCYQKEYAVEFEKWALFSDVNHVSLQIALDGFTIYHEEEFYKCDSTCILGELGGNMGFFLGASVLMGVDIIIFGIKILTPKKKSSGMIERKNSKVL